MKGWSCFRKASLAQAAGWALFVCLLAACHSAPPAPTGQLTLTAPGSTALPPGLLPSITAPAQADPPGPASSTPTPQAAQPAESVPSPTPQPAAAARAPLQYPAWYLVQALAWSPDGSLLAVSAGEKIYIYATADMAQRQVLETGVWASRLAFQPQGPDGREVLAFGGTDGSLQFWDVSSGERICALQAHRHGTNSLDFRPDGQVLASSGNDAMLRLWDVSALAAPGGAEPGTCPVTELAEMIGGAYGVPAVAFSPDAALVAAADGQDIRLRDPATQRLDRTLRGESSMFALAFSPNGSLLAAGEMRSTVRVWDVQTNETLLALSPPAAARVFIWSLAFSPDGSWLAAGGSDGWVRLWEMPSGRLAYAARLHAGGVSTLAFSPDGRLLASGGLDAVVNFTLTDTMTK